MSAKSKVIYLQPTAPAKPAEGAPCNGCGVCCAVETCPVSRLWLLQLRGPCRALEWEPAAQRYRCGMLLRPAFYVRMLPARLAPWFSRRIHRWIAAGAGCDANVSAQAMPDGRQ